MKRYNPNERIQVYIPLHNVLGLINNETENAIEEGKFDDLILESPSSRNQKKLVKQLPDPVERLVIVSLVAKKLADSRRVDDRNILFSLSRIPYFLFPNFSTENIVLYSQTDIEEVNEFMNKITKVLPQHSPRFDNKMIILLKIEYYVNTFLYFAKSMSEKRFPFGSSFYDFISFLIHEFHLILKPKYENVSKEAKNVMSVLIPYLNYTTIIYFFEHFPEQAAELTFILNRIPKIEITKNEKDLLHELFTESILINKKDKTLLLSKLEK